MIDTEILEDYSSEARELLDEMDHSLIRLEKEGGVPELLNNVFRAVHCIKGSAQYIGLESSSTLTHGVENLLDRLREGLLPLDSSVMEFLFRAKDLISTLIEEVAQTREEKSDISGMMENLDKILQRTSTAPPETPAVTGILEDTGEEMEMVDKETDDSWSTAKSSSAFEPEERLQEEAQGVAVQETESVATTQEIEQYKADLKQSDGFEGELLETEEDTLYEPMSYVVREYEEEELVDAEEAPPFFSQEDLEEIRSSASEDAAPKEEESPIVEDAQHDGDASEISEEKELDAILESTVPHLLTLSLYLDDFQDGFLHPSEVIPSFLETLEFMKDALISAGVFEAVDILDLLQGRVNALDADTEAFSSDEIEELRSLLYDLKPYYPEEVFPLGERQFPVPPLGEEPPLESITETGGREAEQPQMVPAAGLAAASVSTGEVDASPVPPHTTAPGAESAEAASIPPQERIVPRVPSERSLMADVDDELLSQFENEFDSVFRGTSRGAAAQAMSHSVGSPEAFSDLAEGLDLSAEEADREIIEIFVDYGMEIVEKLGPVIALMTESEITGENLTSCADFISSIRSSATYMDYQKLASFLDDWYERTRAAVERVESGALPDILFMEENYGRFRSFLKFLRHALHPELGPPLVVTAASQRTVEAGQEPVESMANSAATTLPPSMPIPSGTDKPVGAPVISSGQESGGQAASAAAPRAADAVAQAQRVAPSAPVQTAPMAQTLTEVDDAHPAGSVAAASSLPEMAISKDLQDGAVVKTMRVDSAKVDTLLNQVGELVVNRSYVEQLSLELRTFHRSLMSLEQVTKREIQSIKDLALKVGEASIALGRVATDIQEGVMKLRMLPVGQLFNRMPRLIRDLSRRVGKVVNLEVHGADTEVDKRVIEQIYNPLVHLIRNAVDHGIEDKDARQKLGKGEEGLIILRAYSQGNQVSIDVEDDGAGISRDQVVAKAVEHRLVDAQEAGNLSEQDVFNFLFFPGFSTSKSVTRTSGRGVGMDVVRKDVEKINGHVDVESWENEGTRISIKIPLTLAIIQTLLIRSARHVFAIPLTSVREIVRISPHEITTIEGFEVIKFREETIPVLRISEVFHLQQPEGAKQPRFLVLATAGPRTVGFLVEELIGEQDVVIKPLADHVFKNRGLAGSTILGDGTIALVLDVSELIEDIIAEQRMLAGQPARYLSSESQYEMGNSLEM